VQSLAPSTGKWENNMKRLTLTGLIAALMALALTGCTPQARQEYGQAGDNLGAAAKKTGDAAATDAKVSGEVIKDAAAESKKAADNSVMTGQVRAAITAAHDLKIKDLNVDTVGNKIILKGTVADDRSKKQAEDIATGQAGKDYTVDNQLVIGSVN
jgi:osmotically-inducible protein OsmY